MAGWLAAPAAIAAAAGHSDVATLLAGAAGAWMVDSMTATRFRPPSLPAAAAQAAVAGGVVAGAVACGLPAGTRSHRVAAVVAAVVAAGAGSLLRRGARLLRLPPVELGLLWLGSLAVMAAGLATALDPVRLLTSADGPATGQVYTAVTVLLGGTGLCTVGILLPVLALRWTRGVRGSAAFWGGMVGGVVACGEYPLLWHLLAEEPFTWVAGFIASSPANIAIFCWFSTVLGATLTAGVLAHPSRRAVPPAGGGGSGTGPVGELSLWARMPPHHRTLLLRKVFHAAAAALFVPPLLAAPTMLLPMVALSAAVAFKVLVMVEAARALRIWPAVIPATIQSFMGAYLDARDDGSLVRTHLYLLLACVVPMWVALSVVASPPAAAALSPAWRAAAIAPPVVLSGLIAVGLGDGAAAAAGILARAAGRVHSWARLARLPPTSPAAAKSAEGTVACAATVAACSLCVVGATAGARQVVAAVPGALLAAAAVAAVETFAGTVDNLVVPLTAWLATSAAWAYATPSL